LNCCSRSSFRHSLAPGAALSLGELLPFPLPLPLRMGAMHLDGLTTQGKDCEAGGRFHGTERRLQPSSDEEEEEEEEEVLIS
jgi:hypothetical protein